MAFDLSSIRKGRLIKRPICTIYGDPKVGKTTFGCSAPSPIVIQAEEGLGMLDVPHFPKAETFDDVMSALASLYSENHEFESLVVDSLDHVEPLIWAEVCREHNVANLEALPYGRGYTEALARWRQFLDGVAALRDQKNMFVILIAHSQVVRIEDPTQPAFDAHSLKLHKKAAALVQETSDVIGYAAQKLMTVTEDAGFNAKRTRAKTTGERVLHVAPNPAFVAGNRYSLPPTLPLDWPAFQQSIEQPTQ